MFYQLILLFIGKQFLRLFLVFQSKILLQIQVPTSSVSMARQFLSDG